MKRFTLTEEHVTLLRASNVRWYRCEAGAAGIDCKRPYGNTDVVGDMAEIFGVETVEDQWGQKVVLKEDADRFRALHEELDTALQIVLTTGCFEPGEYIADDYHRNWRALEDGGGG